MLELKNISIEFDDTPVLHNLSCTIHTSDFVVIVGANGAGKSTLFDIISGRRKPSTGSIVLDERDITKLSEIERSLFIGRLFENPRQNCVETMTVKENLSMALYKNRPCTLDDGIKNFERHKIIKKLRSLNIEIDDLLNTPMLRLSNGQRQLISFIMQTFVQPKLFLFDEPTASLDPEAATNLLTFATEYIKKNRITTLLITHDPHIALSIANKIWVLQDGVIAKEYSNEDKDYLSPDDLMGHIDYEKLRGLTQKT